MKNLSILLVLFAFCMALASCQKDDTTTPPNPGGGGGGNDTTFTARVTGNFVAQNGYQAAGAAQIGSTNQDANVIRLAPDFTASLSTGAVTLYLSQNKQLTLGQAASFQRISLVTKPGEQVFVLPAAPSAAHTYAILWCASAGVQFGYAELK